MLPDAVFQVAGVRLLHILWQVAEERKRRVVRRQLRHVLDLDELAFHGRRRVALNVRQDLIVQLGRRDFLRMGRAWGGERW